MTMRPARSPFLSFLQPAIRFFLIIIFSNPVFAAQINGTIDDNQRNNGLTGAKIDYSGTWQLGSACSPECELQPDPSNMVNATWHYARTNKNDPVAQSFNLTFLGTAVYIYGVAFSEIQSPQDPFALVNLSFSLNGQPSGSYFEGPLDGPPHHFEYNRAVYNKTGLSGGLQTLQVILNRDPSNHTAFLFDYAEYTYDGPTETTSSTTQATPTTLQTSESDAGRPSHPTAIIVGAVLGTMTLITIVLTVIICFLRRRRRVRRLAPGTSADLSPTDAGGDVFAQGSMSAAGSSPPLQRKTRSGHLNESAGTSSERVQREESTSLTNMEVNHLQAQPLASEMIDSQTLPAYDDVRRGA